MAEQEVKLMKGNEAIAHAAIRCGADGYFGYPITPQSEIIETLAALKPWETTGMVVLQAESEVASINMIYGGAGAGKRVLTSSSSPGVALMQEGISYMAGAELPGVFVNVQRGGPGLGTIQPSQSDYFQATRGGGNGDYNVIVLAPNSVQEMADFVDQRNLHLQEKYRQIRENEVRFETQQCEDADYVIVSFGSAARIGEKAVELAREQGLKVGLFRPITLWPFPSKQLADLCKGKKGILVSEINAGQMVQDVRLAIDGALPVEHFGRLGGIVPDPEEIVNALKEKLVK